jgi:invasion protein IalB
MKSVLTAVIGIATMLFAGTAIAQDAKLKVGERIGDWTFQCQAVSADQNVCGLLQTIADNKSRQQVLVVAVRHVGEEKKLGMFVTAPLGIFLGSGIGGKVDDGEQFKFNLQTCTQRGCQAATAIEGKRLKELKKGNRLLIGFKAHANAKTITVPVSLKGFTAGLKAIGAN